MSGCEGVLQRQGGEVGLLQLRTCAPTSVAATVTFGTAQWEMFQVPTRRTSSSGPQPRRVPPQDILGRDHLSRPLGVGGPGRLLQGVGVHPSRTAGGGEPQGGAWGKLIVRRPWEGCRGGRRGDWRIWLMGPALARCSKFPPQVLVLPAQLQQVLPELPHQRHQLGMLSAGAAGRHGQVGAAPGALLTRGSSGELRLVGAAGRTGGSRCR